MYSHRACMEIAGWWSQGLNRFELMQGLKIIENEHAEIVTNTKHWSLLWFRECTQFMLQLTEFTFQTESEKNSTLKDIYKMKI